jgi:hypothetical protein
LECSHKSATSTFFVFFFFFFFVFFVFFFHAAKPWLGMLFEPSNRPHIRHHCFRRL